MAAFRAEGLKEVAGIAVVKARDYKTGEVLTLADGTTAPTGLPSSDMLFYELADGSSYIIRPSGTEPKIKVYILAKGETEADVDAKLATLTEFTKTLF